jgi:hypothetical protein
MAWCCIGAMFITVAYVALWMPLDRLDKEAGNLIENFLWACFAVVSVCMGTTSIPLFFQRGVVALMASAHADPNSALYATCTAAHSAGARILFRAQAEGTAHAEMDGNDLFALMSALGWLVGQPSFAPRADHLFHLNASAILTNRSKATC